MTNWIKNNTIAMIKISLPHCEEAVPELQILLLFCFLLFVWVIKDDCHHPHSHNDSPGLSLW